MIDISRKFLCDAYTAIPGKSHIENYCFVRSHLPKDFHSMGALSSGHVSKWWLSHLSFGWFEQLKNPLSESSALELHWGWHVCAWLTTVSLACCIRDGHVWIAGWAFSLNIMLNAFFQHLHIFFERNSSIFSWCLVILASSWQYLSLG